MTFRAQFRTPQQAVPPQRARRGPLGMWAVSDRPPQQVVPFTGARHTLAAMQRAALGPRGEQSMLVRQFAETVTRGLEAKDYLVKF